MDSHCTVAYKEALDKAVFSLLNAYPEIRQLQGKTFFITGATGQLGSAFVNLIASVGKVIGGIRVFAGCRNREKFEEKFSRLGYPWLSYLSYDAMKPFVSEETLDYIVHCAGYGDPAAFVEDPVGVLRTNFYGVDYMLRFLTEQQSGTMLYVSSGEVYGQPTANIESFSEDYLTDSIDSMSYRSCYPIAKKAGETLCSCYHKQYGVKAVVARQCHVFGPGFSDRDSRVTAELLTKAACGEDLVLRSDGSQVRSYLFEIDACCAYLTLLLRGEAGGVYNVSPAYTVSIKELAEEIARSANVKLTFEIPDKNENSSRGYGGIVRSVLDSSKLRDLGWEEQFLFEQAVDITIKALIS